MVRLWLGKPPLDFTKTIACALLLLDRCHHLIIIPLTLLHADFKMFIYLFMGDLPLTEVAFLLWYLLCFEESRLGLLSFKLRLCFGSLSGLSRCPFLLV
jgi:hypothetical protein